MTISESILNCITQLSTLDHDNTTTNTLKHLLLTISWPEWIRSWPSDAHDKRRLVRALVSIPDRVSAQVPGGFFTHNHFYTFIVNGINTVSHIDLVPDCTLLLNICIDRGGLPTLVHGLSRIKSGHLSPVWTHVILQCDRPSKLICLFINLCTCPNMLCQPLFNTITIKDLGPILTCPEFINLQWSKRAACILVLPIPHIESMLLIWLNAWVTTMSMTHPISELIVLCCGLLQAQPCKTQPGLLVATNVMPLLQVGMPKALNGPDGYIAQIIAEYVTQLCCTPHNVCFELNPDLPVVKHFRDIWTLGYTYNNQEPSINLGQSSSTSPPLPPTLATAPTSSMIPHELIDSDDDDDDENCSLDRTFFVNSSSVGQCQNWFVRTYIDALSDISKSMIDVKDLLLQVPDVLCATPQYALEDVCGELVNALIASNGPDPLRITALVKLATLCPKPTFIHMFDSYKNHPKVVNQVLILEVCRKAIPALSSNQPVNQLHDGVARLIVHHLLMNGPDTYRHLFLMRLGVLGVLVYESCHSPDFQYMVVNVWEWLLSVCATKPSSGLDSQVQVGLLTVFVASLVNVDKCLTSVMPMVPILYSFVKEWCESDIESSELKRTGMELVSELVRLHLM